MGIPKEYINHAKNNIVKRQNGLLPELEDDSGVLRMRIADRQIGLVTKGMLRCEGYDFRIPHEDEGRDYRTSEEKNRDNALREKPIRLIREEKGITPGALEAEFFVVALGHRAKMKITGIQTPAEVELRGKSIHDTGYERVKDITHQQGERHEVCAYTTEGGLIFVKGEKTA